MKNPISTDFDSLYENLIPFRKSSQFLYFDTKEDNSKSFYLSSVIEDIIDTFIKENKIGTMAYENKVDYAKLSHDHDYYTSATYITDTNPELSIDMIQCSNIGTIKIKKQTVDHSGDEEREVMKHQPKIGTIMFLGSEQDLSNGWVLADGSTYNSSQYKQSDILIKYYGINEYQFQVPNINGFFKPHIVADNNGLTSTNAQIGYLTHDHSISRDGSTITINLTEFTISGDNFFQSASSAVENTTSNLTHHGSSTGTQASREATMTKEITFTLPNMRTNAMNHYGSGTETHPSYQEIAAYIYIGDIK